MSRMIDRLADAEWQPPLWLRSDALKGLCEMPEESIAGLGRSQMEQLREAADKWLDPSGFRDPLLEALRGKPTIVADNVFQLCWENVVDAEDDYGLKSCPNAAPPFPSFWIEARIPKGAIDYHSIGCMVDAMPVDEAGKVGDVLDCGSLVRIAEAHPDAKWVVHALVLLQKVRGEVFPLCSLAVAVDAEGRVLGDYDLGVRGKELATNEAKGAFRLMLAFLFNAIAFMHCKNVKQVPSEDNRKLNAARVKRGKKPLFRYHTLQIEGMRTVLATEGRIGSTGIKQALHICRGHFKRFDDKPLFGRHRGLYWWEQQVRGRSREGVVVKDYAMKPPGTEAVKEEPAGRHMAGAAQLVRAEEEDAGA